ncbi:hypothetical protein EVJ50_02965 [Synechococcus sp. RSCCF101]|uniref:GIVxVP protein n=1 Tax=Synechococcus sp. RSCCF101 TaxID=2511069 RepID=UPI001243C87E|nr:GIVxVP protein [Synechococcus sp. RSCCF101]QEY31368.1 hypothetical protein EVJ50_02965 [Synechococcus sp. RSCCF101]
MSLNRTAKGIVLVPSLLLGAAFLAAAAWGGGPESANRSLALGLGLSLMATGLLTQLFPDRPERSDDDTPAPGPGQPDTASGDS